MNDKNIPVHLTKVYYKDESKKDKLVFEYSDGNDEVLDVLIDGEFKKVNLPQNLLKKIG